MGISIRQLELERRAVRDFACPNTLCEAPMGEHCWNPRRWPRTGYRGRKATPKAHPHKERTNLVPGRTQGALSFGEMAAQRGLTLTEREMNSHEDRT